MYFPNVLTSLPLTIGLLLTIIGPYILQVPSNLNAESFPPSSVHINPHISDVRVTKLYKHLIFELHKHLIFDTTSSTITILRHYILDYSSTLHPRLSYFSFDITPSSIILQTLHDILEYQQHLIL